MSPGGAIDLRTSAAEAATNQLRRELLDGAEGWHTITVTVDA